MQKQQRIPMSVHNPLQEVSDSVFRTATRLQVLYAHPGHPVPRPHMKTGALHAGWREKQRSGKQSRYQSRQHTTPETPNPKPPYLSPSKHCSQEALECKDLKIILEVDKAMIGYSMKMTGRRSHKVFKFVQESPLNPYLPTKNPQQGPSAPWDPCPR